MSTFKITTQDNCVIVKLQGNIENQQQVQAFMTEYEELLQNHDTTSKKLYVLFNLQVLSISLSKPKELLLFGQLLRFFGRLKELSDSKIDAAAVCMNENGPSLTKKLQQAVDSSPGKVKTLVSNKLTTCKRFLRANMDK